MRSLILLCLLFPAAPVISQDASSLGKLAVSAVTDHYIINTTARLPDTHQPLPSNGKWSVKTARPDSCPHDETPCARVVYSVPDSNVMCEWTVVPGQSAAPAAFLDQNEDASRYLLRKLTATDLDPLVVKSPQPVYPAIAKAARLSGSVVVRLLVSEKGTVTSATVLSGPAMLTGAALDAAKHWMFHPLQVGAQAAPFTIDLKADFMLNVKADPVNCTASHPCGGPMPIGTATMHL